MTDSKDSIAVQVRLKPSESSAHPRAANSTTVGVAQGMLNSWLAIIGCSLLFALTGCGSNAPDNQPGLESRASVSMPDDKTKAQGIRHGEKTFLPPFASENRTGAASGTQVSPGSDDSSQADRPMNQSGGVPNIVADESEKSPVPGIPPAIAKNLDSPDARIRFRALNHWDKQDTKAPLDPVFEALEDEDEAVRAKAEAIIELHWAMAQERERG